MQELIETIKNMKVLELVELKKALEEEFGVSAAAPVMAAGAAQGAGGEAAEEVEEQTEFAAVLTEVGSTKIQVIKVVRQITGLGLKEAKALEDESPKPIKEGVSKDEADEIKTKIEEVGGTVELK